VLNLACLVVDGFGELKGPEELSGDAPHVALSEMDTGADPSAGAVVVVMCNLRIPVSSVVLALLAMGPPLANEGKIEEGVLSGEEGDLSRCS
jgi:hypothetical protein